MLLIKNQFHIKCMLFQLELLVLPTAIYSLIYGSLDLSLLLIFSSKKLL
jgi:hypothetical protein